MFKFDIKKLQVKLHKTNFVSTMQGGIIMVLDEEHYKNTMVEKFNRVNASVAVTRAFSKKYRQSRFMTPVVVAVTYYEDTVVAIELKEYQATELKTEGLFESREWISNSHHKVEKEVREITEKGNWFIDGSFIFQLPCDLDESISQAERLTSDNKFRLLPTQCYKLQTLNSEIKIGLENRTCCIFVASNGQYVVSPPIWKDLFSNHIKKDDKNKTRRFDFVEENFHVNLNFALKAGKDVGKLFGYEATNILQLHEYMITLKTVNLPNLPKEIRATYDIKLPFLTCMAWCLGLCHRATNLNQIVEIRNLIKFLSAKGIFQTKSLEEENIYKKDKSQKDMKVISVEQAELVGNDKYDMDYIDARMNLAQRRMKNQNNEVSTLGGLSSD